VAEQYQNFHLEDAATTGEALLREHWNNHSMSTLGYARDIYNLARIYDELGDFERAIELYTDGAHLFSKHCNGDATAYTACLNNLAAALYDMGMEGPSVHLFGQLVSVKQLYGHEQNEAFADSLYNLANAFTGKNHTVLALRLHKEALDIRRQSGNTQDVVDSLHSLASLHEDKEEYEKAVALAQTAKELAMGDDYACSCYYLAKLYENWGQYDKALTLYGEVMDLTRERVGRTHHSYLDVATRRANMLDKTGFPRQALTLLSEVRAVYEGMEFNHTDLYNQNLRDIAGLHKQLGDYEQAEATLLHSLKISRKNNENLTEDIVELIRFYLYRNDNVRAMEMLVYALMHSDSKGPGLESLLFRLAEAFNPTTDPAPDIILNTLREMNDRVTLAPILEKWKKWESEPFIQGFVMPPPTDRDRT
jgi:tetratricopeptide (TPR) repeat protein